MGIIFMVHKPHTCYARLWLGLPLPRPATSVMCAGHAYMQSHAHLEVIFYRLCIYSCLSLCGLVTVLKAKEQSLTSTYVNWVLHHPHSQNVNFTEVSRKEATFLSMDCSYQQPAIEQVFHFICCIIV